MSNKQSKKETAWEDLGLSQITEIGRATKFFRSLNDWLEKYGYDPGWRLCWAESVVVDLEKALEKARSLVLSPAEEMKALKQLDNKGRKCRECGLVVERDDPTAVDMTVYGPGKKRFHALWHEVCAPAQFLESLLDQEPEEPDFGPGP